MFGEGGTQGSPVSWAGAEGLPALDAYDLQLGLSAVAFVRQKLAVEVAGQLAHRQAVLLDDGLQPHAGGELLCHQRPVGSPSDRVRPVEHDEVGADVPGGDHRVVHGPDVGVEAHPDVLDVEDDGVRFRLAEQLGHLRRVRSVGVVDRQPGARVLELRLGLARLCASAEAVLGAEDTDDVQFLVCGHGVHDVACAPQYARWVADDADLASA